MGTLVGVEKDYRGSASNIWDPATRVEDADGVLGLGLEPSPVLTIAGIGE